MRITAITRYKHGALFEILSRIGWTQSKLARKTELTPGTIGDIINLIHRPTIKQANAIQSALGEEGEYIDVLSEWPETFTGLMRGYKREQTAECEMEPLIGNKEAMMLPAPEVDETTELDSAIETILAELAPREQTVIRERFWNSKTLREVAEKYKVSKDRVRQIEAYALCKLRHPSRISKIHSARDGD